MKMIEIGRICVKLAGRDAGRECAVVDVLDGSYVLIDGNVRRRKCNILHLEPTSKSIDIKKGASHEDVKKEFSKLKVSVWETKAKQKGERPRKIRGKKKLQLEEKTEEKEKKKVKKEKKVKKKEELEEKKPIDAEIASVKKKKVKKESNEKI